MAVPSCFALLKRKAESNADSSCSITYGCVSVDFIKVVPCLYNEKVMFGAANHLY